MRTVGIRELRQQASKYLRDVERGEALEVTDRGRPVALIVPARAGDELGQLEARGRLVRGTGDLLGLGPPIRPARGVPMPSEVLRRARADER